MENYNNEEEIMNATQAKYKFKKNKSLKQEDDLEDNNMNKLIKRKKKMEYDRPWMDFIYKNEVKKRTVQDVNIDELYLGEPKQEK